MPNDQYPPQWRSLSEKEFPMPTKTPNETFENFADRAAFVSCKRDGFIRGLSFSIPLVEALKYLMEGVSGLPPLTAIEGVLIPHWKKAEEALASFPLPST